jgi:hypothetical protein
MSWNNCAVGQLSGHYICQKQDRNSWYLVYLVHTLAAIVIYAFVAMSV